MVNNMADFINVRLPAEFVLDPKLKELVDKLALRHPTFTFGTKGINGESLKNWTSTTPRRGSSTRNIPPREDGLSYLRKVNVHCGSELLGSVSLDIRYNRSSGSEIVYSIASWRIRNERGSQNMTRTAKLDVAVRTAKNVFIPQNTKELMVKAEDSISHALAQAGADLRRPIAHGTLVRSTLELQKYLFYHLKGNKIPANVKQNVENAFTSAKYATAMSEYELAEYMMNKPMKYIHVYNGGYLMWQDDENGERQAVFQTLEELPEQTQNHIAVLQLMQDNELVYDVGYRWDSENFAVLEVSA
jgi:hypothetical protein